MNFIDPFGNIDDLDHSGGNEGERSSIVIPPEDIQDLFNISFKEIEFASAVEKPGCYTAKYQSVSPIPYSVHQKKRVKVMLWKTDETFPSMEEYREFKMEFEILQSIQHPNILKFLGGVYDKETSFIGYIVEDFNMPEIMLFLDQEIEEEKKPKIKLTQLKKIRILYGLVQALRFLHSRRILLRDLTWSSVRLGDRMNTKLVIDRSIQNAFPFDSSFNTFSGSSIYMAPEIVMGERYDSKVDVFSFAIMAYVLLTEEKMAYGSKIVSQNIEFKVANNPFYRPDLKRLKDNKVDFPWMNELLKKCWDAKPESRYSFEKIGEIFRENVENIEEEEKEGFSEFEHMATDLRDERLNFLRSDDGQKVYYEGLDRKVFTFQDGMIIENVIICKNVHRLFFC